MHTFIYSQKRMLLLLMILIGCISAYPNVNGTIDNVTPRYDTSGAILDAHDGRMIKFGNEFYLYGTAYGTSDGYGTTNHFHCYKSTDLINWVFCGNLLSNQPEGVYYRPHVVYNAKRKKYVLWYNWYKTLWWGQYGVAISDNPDGPYTIISQNVTVKNLSKGVGDFSLFVDDDAKGYIVYTTISDHIISVERLTDDYMGSLQTNSGVILPSAEACSMFKRNGTYYVLADKMCQFCTEGSGAQVYTSSSPLGPYAYRGNINNAEKTKYPASAAIDGDRLGTNWGNGGGWNDNSIGYFPDSLEISFNAIRTLTEIDVYTIQDDRPVPPTPTMTFSKGGLTAFDVEYWDGSSWKIVPGGSISGNNLVWRKILFSPIQTEKIRLVARASQDGQFSRVIELEAYENSLNVAAKSNGGTVRASSEYLDASDNIIHAQQTHIAEIPLQSGTAYIWMADRWGSRPDGVKGHDFQYWSEPLVFMDDGSIGRMRFVDRFDLELPIHTKVNDVLTHSECTLIVCSNEARQLMIQSEKDIEATVSVSTISGHVFYRKKHFLESSVPVLLGGTTLHEGLFLVRVQTGDKVYVSKILIQ